MSRHRTTLDWALALGEEGFHVFPLIDRSKLPRIDAYPTRATRDPEQMRNWWTCIITGAELSFNIGISTTRYADTGALIVVDIDNKGAVHGDDTIAEIRASGLVLPETRTVSTPTGGYHMFYTAPEPVKQGAAVLGSGVDIRSGGGYVVGPGSRTENGKYRIHSDAPIAGAPEWLIKKCGAYLAGDSSTPVSEAPPVEIDANRADSAAFEYLKSLPPAAAGERNHRGFIAAAKIKDFGVLESRALELLQSSWACEPPLGRAEIKSIVRSAYQYGRNAPGSAAPEVQFAAPEIRIENPQNVCGSVQMGIDITQNVSASDTLSPLRNMNTEFAYILLKGDHAIMRQSTDAWGKPETTYLSPGTFKSLRPGELFAIGKKQVPITQAWLDWGGRRSYEGQVFAPGVVIPERFYNLWRGFSVEPWPRNEKPRPQDQKALHAFTTHLRENVCASDDGLTRWLTGFFAHMVQRPNEKPLVAAVFRGAKGTGKNALIESVGRLIDAHFTVVADPRYITGQFNSHLENSLFILFDEAFWSGDKQAEGRLKNLITGSHHNIERKGYEIYKGVNLTRVAIIGNENWLVPASHDERRYAVFDVGNGRKQDRSFFQAMREGLERGGYRLLLRYLLDFDLTGVDLNCAPETKALLEQKNSSLGIVEKWWLEGLRDGRIVDSGEQDWPKFSTTEGIRQALWRYARTRGIRSQLPESIAVGRALAKCSGVLRIRGPAEAGRRPWIYSIPALSTARINWERYIGHTIHWDDDTIYDTEVPK